MATATSASLRTGAGRGHLSVPGSRASLPSGRASRCRSAPSPPRLSYLGAGRTGGCRRPAARERFHTAKSVLQKASFFLPPAPRRRGETRCGSRAGRTRASPQRAAGREKRSAGSARAAQRGSSCSRSRWKHLRSAASRGTDPRGGQGAPPSSGGGTADPQLTPSPPPPPPPPPAGTCFPLPVPFPSSAPSSCCPPHAYG